MRRIIKLAAIHSKIIDLPEEANPCRKVFDFAAAEKYVEENMEKAFRYLHEAGRAKADLVCTHEDFRGSSVFMKQIDRPEVFSSFAEEIPGPASYRIGEVAKQYEMYIAANYFEREGNDFYNTTVLIGRAGEVIGKYRKIHLPPYEKWNVKSGREFTILNTDIGKIGFATCYDIIFPEHCRAVALNGADMIIHQTQGWGVGGNAVGEALVRTRAAENSIYMIVAKNIQQPGDSGKSCIISNYGNILAEAREEDEKLVAAEIIPDFDMVQEDHYNALYSGVSSTKARQALEREPLLYSVITKKRPPVLKQYKGIELQTAPEKVEGIYRRWREYEDAAANNKLLRIKYHW